MNVKVNYSTPDAVAEAVAHLEHRLETPIVPGELRGWMAETAKALAAVQPLVRNHFEQNHAEQIKAIADQDPELAHRASTLEEEDGELLAALESLARELAPLAEQCEQVEVPKSGPAYQKAEKLADRGLELVIAFRKQEAALATWFVESLQRDRGAGD